MAHGDREALREIAQHDEPGCATAWADLEAWDRAEGLASDAAGAAIRRKDIERLIPGLPARQTYMVLSRIVVAAFIADIALAYVPPSDGIDFLDGLIRYGTAILGVAVAAWSLLSEVRGWEGSDASTWFLKARVDRTWKRLDARRRVLSETLIAVSPERLVLYRQDGGHLSRDVFEPDAILSLCLEAGARHMTLCLTTSDGTSRFDWLPRDRVFEAEVSKLAGVVRAREAVGTTACV